MSGATSLPNAVLPNKKAADPYQESTATSIATTGQPPASREREARSIARCDLARSTGADRMARYKVNPARRAARKVRGASCERHATIDTPRTAGVPLCPRRLDARHAPICSQRAVTPVCLQSRECGNLWGQMALRPGPQQRVNDIAQERTAPRSWAAPVICNSSGISNHLAPRCRCQPGRRLSASTPGTSVPLARLRKELPAMLRSASRFGD
jgi:hypothetical protein